MRGADGVAVFLLWVYAENFWGLGHFFAQFVMLPLFFSLSLSLSFF
jgi:hypothetical protein